MYSLDRWLFAFAFVGHADASGCRRHRSYRRYARHIHISAPIAHDYHDRLAVGLDQMGSSHVIQASAAKLDTAFMSEFFTGIHIHTRQSVDGGGGYTGYPGRCLLKKVQHGLKRVGQGRLTVSNVNGFFLRVHGYR